jgi:hypothetical protein
VEDAITTFFQEWSRRASECGDRVSNEITASTLKYDERYSQALNEGVQTVTRIAVRDLAQKINAVAYRYEQSPLSDTSALTKLLTPPTAHVVMPEEKGVGGGATAGATAGAVVGTILLPFLPGVGTALGAIVGGAFGAAVNESSNDEEAAKEIQANVLRAAGQVIANFQSKRQDAIDFILVRCTVEVGSQEQIDDQHLRPLEAMVQTISQLLETASFLQ